MDNEEILYLENQLCFPLYATSRLTTKLYTPLLKELEITYPQYLVLLVLWQRGQQSVGEISNRLYLESNTLTPLLKRMEQKQLIHRKRSDADERNVMISLSLKGEKLKEKAVCIPARIVESLQDESINPSEIESFKSTLQKILEVLENKV